MLSVLERGENPLLRQLNFEKIVSVGTPIVTAGKSEDSAVIDSLTLKDGEILQRLTLSTFLRPQSSRINLRDSNERKIAEYYLARYTTREDILTYSISTYIGEGSGIGAALFELGELLLPVYIDFYSLRSKYVDIFILATDLAHKRRLTPKLKTGWTTQIMSDHGYTNDNELLQRLGCAVKDQNRLIKRV